MSGPWKDRLLLGAGAGACAVCCAGPLLASLGIAGVAATIGTFVFAGAAFALVVGVATLVVVLRRRRASRLSACGSAPGPVDVVLGATSAPETRR